jgi:hypothetical protein
MGIEEVIIAARSPWQSPTVERMIGSVRRECLENVVVLSERLPEARRTVIFHSPLARHQGMPRIAPRTSSSRRAPMSNRATGCWPR